jgi:hypothetical protein
MIHCVCVFRVANTVRCVSVVLWCPGTCVEGRAGEHVGNAFWRFYAILVAAVVSCLMLSRILNVSFRVFMLRLWVVKSLSVALFMVYNLLLGPDFVFESCS